MQLINMHPHFSFTSSRGLVMEAGVPGAMRCCNSSCGLQSTILSTRPSAKFLASYRKVVSKLTTKGVVGHGQRKRAAAANVRRLLYQVGASWQRFYVLVAVVLTLKKIKVYPETCTYYETFQFAKLSGLSLSLVL